MVGTAKLSLPSDGLLGVPLGTSGGARDLECVADGGGILLALSAVAALGYGGIVPRLQESVIDGFLQADRHLGKRLQEVALQGDLGVGVAAGNIRFLDAFLVQVIGKPLVIDGIDAAVWPGLVECHGDGVVFDVLRKNRDGGRSFDGRKFGNPNGSEHLDVAGAVGGWWKEEVVADRVVFGSRFQIQGSMKARFVAGCVSWGIAR